MIGGSIALAVRRHERAAARFSPCGAATRPNATPRGGLGLPDAPSSRATPLEAVCGARLVILCTPPASLPAIGRPKSPRTWSRGRPSATWPASEGRGRRKNWAAIFEASRRQRGRQPLRRRAPDGRGRTPADWPRRVPTLFDGCVCLLTPLEGTYRAGCPVGGHRRFWEGLGARVRRLSPGGARRGGGRRQPPAAPAGRRAGMALPDADARACAGPGWRDMTRLAAGSPELWTEILSRNRSAGYKCAPTLHRPATRRCSRTSGNRRRGGSRRVLEGGEPCRRIEGPGTRRRVRGPPASHRQT